SNLTILLISHSMEDVARYAKELIVLYRGEVAFTGETREIFKHRNELEKIGLGVPQIRHIMDELKEKGMDIDNNVLTVEEAAQKLIQYLESGVR
ncbi:MAG: energy-coupling factor transporter ATPase, partial [Niameybacter sp.]